MNFIERKQLPRKLIYEPVTPISFGDSFIFNVIYPYSIVENSYYKKYKPLIKTDATLNNYTNFDEWDKNYFNNELEAYTRELNYALITKKDNYEFFCIQGATFLIKHYNKNLNLIKYFGIKPKMFKDPPKLSFKQTQASIEANARFHSNITRWHNIKYDNTNRRLYLCYTNLFEDFYLYRSLMRGDHFIQVYDENYDVIFDGKIDGY